MGHVQFLVDRHPRLVGLEQLLCPAKMVEGSIDIGGIEPKVKQFIGEFLTLDEFEASLPHGDGTDEDGEEN